MEGGGYKGINHRGTINHKVTTCFSGISIYMHHLNKIHHILTTNLSAVNLNTKSSLYKTDHFQDSKTFGNEELTYKKLTLVG